MNCQHPRCLKDAGFHAKLVAVKGKERRELMTDIKTCLDHVPNNSQIGRKMKDFLRHKFSGGRLANMFIVFGVEAVPLTAEESAEHERKRPPAPPPGTD